jgi:hypothetical protein
MKDGVLTVTIPKKEQSSNEGRIKVSGDLQLHLRSKANRVVESSVTLSCGFQIESDSGGDSRKGGSGASGTGATGAGAGTSSAGSGGGGGSAAAGAAAAMGSATGSMAAAGNNDFEPSPVSPVKRANERKGHTQRRPHIQELRGSIDSICSASGNQRRTIKL